MISGETETRSRRPGQRAEAIPRSMAEVSMPRRCECGDRYHGVRNLMFAGERAVNAHFGTIMHSEGAALGGKLHIIDVPFFLRVNDFDAQVGGAPIERLQRLRPLRRENRRYTRLQYPRLLSRDGFETLAEQSFVIEIHWSDDAQFRMYDIGRVQAATQTDFKHDRLGLLGLEKVGRPWR